MLHVLRICLQCVIDRNQYLYRDRTIGPSLLACEAEEPERGNHEVGDTYGCGGFDLSIIDVCLLRASADFGYVKSTLKFINEDAASVHGAVRASSIFACESGDWKLGGFDVLSSMNDENAIIYVGRPLGVLFLGKSDYG